MYRFRSHIRNPIPRQGAEQYILFALLSFASSVTLTRLFLYLTGYPQLGGNGFHIAHVLWGGLLLFIASLGPLIVANRWVYTASALVSGAGVGLFIDEVGKFITSNNDYFSPLAAPIIYAFFLLTVLLYMRVRRAPIREPRAALYHALDGFEEVLEHDLDPRERAELIETLQYVRLQSQSPELAHLAEHLLEFIQDENLKLVPPSSTIWERAISIWEKTEVRWINRLRARAVLSGSLIALGLVALYKMFLALPIGPSPTSLEHIIQQFLASGQLSGDGSLAWFSARLALETSVGLLLIASGGLFLAGKDELAVSTGYLGLLLSLTTVNLLVFYFEQFSTILSAVFQFMVLLGLMYYRRRFITPKKSDQA
jgi:hypothetical protein